MTNPTENWSSLDPREAIRLQHQMASKVIVQDDLPEVKTVAGVDVGFEDRNTARAAVVVLRLSDLEPLDYTVARMPVAMPYIPGLLSFRECPVILEALAQLTIQPDLLLCDGQGIAHPRRLGLAGSRDSQLFRPSISLSR